MLRKTLTILFCLAMTMSSFAQMKINTNYQTPSKIVVEGKLIVNIFSSEDTDKIDIETKVSNEAFKSLKIKEEDGVLTLMRKAPLSIKKTVLDSIVINIHIANPNNIEAKNKAEVYFGEEFKMGTVNLSSSSSSTIAAIVAASVVNIEATNKGKVTLSGSSDKVEILSNTSGYVNTIQLEATEVYVTAATLAECYVKAKKYLDLKATTTANIFYKGYAETVQKHTATFGNIEQF